MNQVYIYGLDGDALARTEEVLSTMGITTLTEVDSFQHLLAEVRADDLVIIGWDDGHTEEVQQLRKAEPNLHILFLSPTLANEAMPNAPFVAAFVDDEPPVAIEPRPDDNTDDILTLMELGRLLTSTLELEDLYDQIIEQVQVTFRPNTVSLMVLSHDARRLRIVAHRGLSNNITPNTEVPVDDSIAGRVVREGKPQLLLGGLQGTEFARLARRDSKIASAMSIPLQVKDKTLGVLNVNRYRGQLTYTDKDASLLHIFATQIAIALQNAQLYASLRQERDRIMEAQEVVRRELARDLHDGLSQMLAAMAVNVGVLQTILKPGEIVPDIITEDLEFLHNAVRQAIQDARTLTFGLRPLVLETQGIVAAMRQYIATLQKSDKKTHYELIADKASGQIVLPVNDSRMIFAIIQEAINNARKHAKAANVSVTLKGGQSQEEPLLITTIQDDGAGFNVAEITADYEERLSFGLNTMRERADLIDATLSVQSVAGGGTTIQLVVPRNKG
jgi:signal transduction histidine kinase